MKKSIQAKLSGFTLIELLVVVLIVGILSAIALPQYQKAVLNSKMTQAIVLFGTYKQAIDMYLLENGWSDSTVYFTGTKGAGILGINTPLLSEQTEYYDANRNLGMWAYADCTSTSCIFQLAGWGADSWLNRCGLQFARGSSAHPKQGGWIFAGVMYDALHFATEGQCVDVVKIACQYAKSNFSEYGTKLPTQCSSVGITLD